MYKKNICFSCIRELAYQIADQFRVFGKPLGLKDCVITGGMGKSIIILFFFYNFIFSINRYDDSKFIFN